MNQIHYQVPPNYSPILLFPCGHTFCKTCTYQNSKNPAIRNPIHIQKCPLCRQNVTSVALNISLQNLICAYTNNLHLLNQQNDVQDDKEEVEEILDYKNQLNMCKMRTKILEEEKQMLVQQKQEYVEGQVSQKQVYEMLLQNRNDVNDKLIKLQKELLLIDQYMQKAQQELSEYDNLIDNTDQKLYMINETIEPLKQQKQKYELIIKSLKQNQK